MATDDLVLVIGYPERLQADHEALVEAAHQAGFVTDLVAPSRISLSIGGGQPTEVLIDGAPCQPAVALPRGVNRPWPLVRQFLEVWSAAGTVIVPGLDAADRVADKVRTARVLAAAGIPIIATVAVIPGSGVAIEPNHPHGQIIVKPARGSKARGVEVHDTLADTVASLRVMRPLIDDVVDHQVVQSLATSAGTDYRVIVARTEPGDAPPRTIAITRRHAPAGTIITNRAGSTTEDVDPTTIPEIAYLAEAAAMALGLDFGGIDIIEHEGEPVVLEANAWPGLAPEHRGRQLADALIAVARRALGLA
jgi:glutathione synthase/RimK-type ligase-like ATP-grasp enzyme